ncbi:hypothetical protein SAMN04488543_0106 [Friedmanniella luteola]|uniref:Uncharacterized protein n=1 Tax=Friedmanniella luteola TaxID=546871 RepID=A0A1H1L6M6_9ACTN|nr:hypothetical protein [Friedmanniella luteola]SDR69952.1 hypothetical protein SAMN04488543_0106 [Friedmanniella luteola]
MSNQDVPTDGADESVDPGALPEPEGSGLTDPDEYGSLSVEDDPEGTVNPADLAGGADETDEDVS